jgi:hypothetical protein
MVGLDERQRSNWQTFATVEVDNYPHCSWHCYRRIAMRRILLAMLISLGLSACVHTVAGQASVSPNFDCEPMELAAFSNELGRILCVQHEAMKSLDVTNPAIEAAARALVQHPTGDQPSGDPNVITCRQDPELTDDNRQPAVACAYNSYFSFLATHGPDVPTKEFPSFNYPPQYAYSPPIPTR